MTKDSDAYKGQYLKPRERKNGSPAWYFKPKPEEIPKGWIERYGKTVRVPVDSAKRVGGKVEKAHAMVDAAELFKAFNKMRRAPESAGGSWPHGSLRWVIDSYRESDWYKREIKDDTRRGYAQILTQIEGFADERAKARGGVHKSLAAATRNEDGVTATIKSLQGFLNRWAAHPTHQKHVKTMLSILFKHAMAEGVVHCNPAENLRVKRVKANKKRQRPVVLWDQTFVTKAIAEAQSRNLHEIAAWIQTMWDIGRRNADLNNLLLLDDITRERLERGLLQDGIYYDPQTQAVRGWQSKTHSFGSIPLEDLTIELIERCRPRAEDGASHRHVFIDSRPSQRRPFDFGRFAYQFRPIAVAAGLVGTTPQMGRHSCIMRYRRSGMSFADIKSITGHFDEKTIERFYVVEDDSALQAMKDRRAAAEKGN